MNESVVDSRSYNHVRVYKAVVGSLKNKYFLCERGQEVRHVLPLQTQSAKQTQCLVNELNNPAVRLKCLRGRSALSGYLIRVMHVSILITSLN